MTHGPCNTGTHLPTFRTLPRGTIQNQVISDKTVSYFRYLQGCYLEGEAGGSMGVQKEKHNLEVEGGRREKRAELQMNLRKKLLWTELSPSKMHAPCPTG